MPRLRSWLGLVLLTAFTAIAALPASAHDHAYDSKVTINEPSSYNYKGRVKSSFDACEPDRTVKVYEKQPGDDMCLGSDTTDAEGRWQFGLVGEHYYAKVTRAVLTPGSHRHVCRGDTSPTI